jgi:hypothetical protein
MGFINGFGGIIGQYFRDNFANGEFWKHFPAYVTFAIGGYVMGKGCMDKPLLDLDKKIIQQYDAVKDKVTGSPTKPQR